MLLFELVIALICCYMAGYGMGKLRWETEKFIARHSGLVKLTPRKARKLNG